VQGAREGARRPPRFSLARAARAFQAGSVIPRSSTTVRTRLEASFESPLASADTGRTAYRGSLADLAGEALGTFAPAEAHTYQLSVALPSSAGNELQGLSAGASFTWSAVSA
jgi:hypothetical protein